MTDKRLGKGLQALITSYSTENDRSMDGNVSIDDIIPNRNQPRQDFNQEQLDELTKSIASSGILQPLTVRESSEGKYELIAGERRLRAAKNVGLKSVPVYVLSIDADVEMMEYALIENVQRVDLNPLEEAEGYAILSGKYGLSQEKIASRVGKSRPVIANSLRLLKLPPEIKLSLKQGCISAGHARSILSLKKTNQMVTLYQKIIYEKLNVRQTEELVKKYLESKTKIKKIKNVSSPNLELTKIENDLVRFLGTKVTVQKNNKGKGKIHMDFYSDSDLQRLLDIIIK
tara:strand:- start:497 stop:1357 length:861 start_codon:yes stop_codon:yes gene_type:complete